MLKRVAAASMGGGNAGLYGGAAVELIVGCETGGFGERDAFFDRFLGFCGVRVGEERRFG